MGKLLAAYENQKSVFPIVPRPHRLDKKLIVSMTSYRPRFKWLHLTLSSLLEQTVIPDAIILWVSKEEIDELPKSVQRLDSKITILQTRDIYSYKKIIPTIHRFPHAHIVICDDDIYYPRNWLDELVVGFTNDSQSIPSHMVARYHYLSGGKLAPYYDWSFDVQDNKSRIRSSDIIANGVGGVFYPNGSLYSDVTNEALFMKLCPSSDDLWLYVMARLNGFLPVKVGNRLHPIFWPGTQSTGLFKENMYKNDDLAINNLIAYYGSEVFSTASEAIS